MTAHFGAARILTLLHLHFRRAFTPNNWYNNRASFMVYLHAVSASFRNCMVNKSLLFQQCGWWWLFCAVVRTRRWSKWLHLRGMTWMCLLWTPWQARWEIRLWLHWLWSFEEEKSESWLLYAWMKRHVEFVLSAFALVAYPQLALILLYFMLP
jgi:hypothetical protein